MKNYLLILLVLLTLIVASIYLFLPQKVEVGKIYDLKGNAAATLRILSDSTRRANWWPGTFNKEADRGSVFKYNDIHFKPGHTYTNGAVIFIKWEEENIESNLTVVPLNSDSVRLIWKCDLPESNHPVRRIKSYYLAKNIRNSMTGILEKLDHFLQNEENIYGIQFEIKMSKDSTLVMTKKRFTTYPSEKQIYDLVNQLQSYTREEGALETNHPMLDVKRTGKNEFETMVAIPVNKELAGKGDIYFSRFVPWKVLTAEVTGGVSKVEEALHQMDLYISDHKLTRMAVSFQSLVTNRMEQPDSTQWITRIYTPVP